MVGSGCVVIDMMILKVILILILYIIYTTHYITTGLTFLEIVEYAARLHYTELYDDDSIAMNTTLSLSDTNGSSNMTTSEWGKQKAHNIINQLGE